MEPTTGGVKGWQWVVTVIVIIILIVLGYYMFKGGSTPTDTTGTDTTGGVDNPTALNRVVVSDQFPGNIIYVSSVQLEKPGFVVIHKDDKGKPGAVIGSQYFDKGINPGKITLTTATLEGGIYYAMLHSDTDGDKKFDEAKDLPLKDASGNTIMKLFRVSSTVTEVKG
jgi:heme/copper-type cytochrome/quinol oxidase subunit 2